MQEVKFFYNLNFIFSLFSSERAAVGQQPPDGGPTDGAIEDDILERSQRSPTDGAEDDDLLDRSKRSPAAEAFDSGASYFSKFFDILDSGESA